MAASPENRTPEFERARRETVRYHEELYAEAALGAEGTWLARPHRLIFDAVALMPDDRPITAYDLGAGIGRHTVPMVERLAEGSTVHAVDLLASAVRRLEAIPAPGTTRVLAQQADLADLEFANRVDLVFAFSAVEHLPDVAEIRRLFAKIAAAVREGGVVALGVIADRYEVDQTGESRPALLESGITVADVEDLLATSFAGFETISRAIRPAAVVEHRGDEEYTLLSALVTWIGRRGASPGPGNRGFRHPPRCDSMNG
ncbi:class I SAM-dependent methyltransferase [Microbacterium sp. NPDC057650]|uniref:class I SAM-dependent methyltransferase n=1 Tax=unclassified Microbacterium TaxID=2609290 RepID=UPI00366A88E3